MATELFLNSEYVKVFPASNRNTVVSGTSGEDSVTYNPESKLTLEENLVNITNSWTNGASFVVSENTTAPNQNPGSLEFVIFGYRFTLTDDIYSIFDANSWTNVYVLLEVEPNTFIDNNITYNFKNLKNLNTGTSTGNLDENISGTDYFTGLKFIDTEPDSLTDNQHLLWLLKKENTNWKIPEESRFLIPSNLIFNVSDRTSILQNFASTHLNSLTLSSSYITCDTFNGININDLFEKEAGGRYEPTVKNATNATNAENITTSINGKQLSNIFETNGTTVKNATNANNAKNVTTSINGKTISEIFESDGTTVKNATSADNATNTSFSTVTFTEVPIFADNIAHITLGNGKTYQFYLKLEKKSTSYDLPTGNNAGYSKEKSGLNYINMGTLTVPTSDNNNKDTPLLCFLPTVNTVYVKPTDAGSNSFKYGNLEELQLVLRRGLYQGNPTVPYYIHLLSKHLNLWEESINTVFNEVTIDENTTYTLYYREIK